MRTVIIGDIHGCFDEFEELLRKIDFDASKDRLILNGDLMDRGKSSYEVFCKAVKLKAEMGDRMTVIKGSHEKMLLDHSNRFFDRMIWRLAGKGAALRSFCHNGANMQDSADWFGEHCVLYYEAEHFQCVHAAVKNASLAEQDEYTLTMDHRLVRKNTYTGKLTVVGHVVHKHPTFYDGSGKKGQRLKYGVWQPLPSRGIICIDTGCAEGNKLTAMIIQDDRFYLEYVKMATVD